MTALIIDDEKHCREVLSHLMKKFCPDITILGTCTGAEDALIALKKTTPDLLFLDIEMPGMNGFELLEKFKHPGFEIIFTTAYNEYAIKAIKHSALDYLLKPVDKDELKLAVQRARDHKMPSSLNRVDRLLEILKKEKQGKRFAVPTLEGLIMVNSDDIIYCESDSSYCKLFFTNGKNLLLSKTLKEVEEVITPENDFCRIHHSYLINMKYILRYIRGEGGEVVMNNGITLPVSRSRKQDFLNMLEKI